MAHLSSSHRSPYCRTWGSCPRPARHLTRRGGLEVRDVKAGDPHGARARFLAAVSRLDGEGERTRPPVPGVRRGASRSARGDLGVRPGFGPGSALRQRQHRRAGGVGTDHAGRGAGLDAVAADGPMIVDDLSDPSGRWPTFAAEAVESGVGAMYSLPLEVGAIQVGRARPLPRRRREPLNARDFADAMAVAELVTAILLTVGRTRPDHRVAGTVVGPTAEHPGSASGHRHDRRSARGDRPRGLRPDAGLRLREGPDCSTRSPTRW